MKVGNLVTWSEPSPYPEQCQLGVIITIEACTICPEDQYVQIQWADEEKGSSRSWEQVQDIKVIA